MKPLVVLPVVFGGVSAVIWLALRAMRMRSRMERTADTAPAIWRVKSSSRSPMCSYS